MKFCPVCQQAYSNAALKFCRFDGNQLVGQQVSASDAPTVLLTKPVSELFGWTAPDAVPASDERQPDNNLHPSR